MSILTKGDNTHAYVLVLKFSTYALMSCVTYLSSEPKPQSKGINESPKGTLQCSVVSHHVGRHGVARRETLLSVRRSDPVKPDSDC
jgi:hypothetical protein